MLRLLTVFLLCSLPLFAGAQVPSPTLERIAESGKFRIGYVPDAAPLSFKDSYGNPVGYSISLCRLIAVSIRDSLGLENGVHLSYPGHGQYRPGFDPRQRPWYRQVIQTDDASWLSYEDVSTGRIVFTAGMPIKDAQGRVIGAAAIDFLPEEFFKLEKLQTQWSDQTRAFIVIPQSLKGRV